MIYVNREAVNTHTHMNWASNKPVGVCEYVSQCRWPLPSKLLSPVSHLTLTAIRGVRFLDFDVLKGKYNWKTCTCLLFDIE